VDGKVILCPAMNARRSQVYNALFVCENGVVTRLCDDRALAISELLNELETMNLPVYLMGDGASLVYEAQGDRFDGKLRMLPDRLIHQSGYNTAMCALRLWRDGVRTTDAELSPVYLRPSQAERTRAEKLAAEGNT
jgi:tRNA threonylcarbamoyladenosine biosynthesis protein TsaB